MTYRYPGKFKIRLLKESHEVYIIKTYPGSLHAVIYSAGGELRRVLEAAEPFFLRGGGDTSVPYDSRGGIMIITRDPEDVHGLRVLP